MHEFEKYRLDAERTEDNLMHLAKIYYFKVLEALKQHNSQDLISNTFEMSIGLFVEANADQSSYLLILLDNYNILSRCKTEPPACVGEISQHH